MQRIDQGQPPLAAEGQYLRLVLKKFRITWWKQPEKCNGASCSEIQRASPFWRTRVMSGSGAGMVPFSC